LKSQQNQQNLQEECYCKLLQELDQQDLEEEMITQQSLAFMMEVMSKVTSMEKISTIF
jgi:hypothetical protein